MLDILAITTPIFLLIGIGFLAVMLRLFSKDQVQGLSGFVINFALPALIFRALVQRPLDEVFNPVYLAAYGGGSALLFLGAWLLARHRGKPLGESGILALGMSAANSGFIGYPVAAMVVGSSAVIALALNMMVENLLIIPTALALGEAGRQTGVSFFTALRRTAVRLTRNPILIGIFAGILAALSGITLPAPISRTIDMLATAAAPTALFVIGGTLYGLRIGGMLGDVAQVVTGKLLLHPLIVFLLLWWLPPIDPALATAAVVIASAPMISIYPLLGQRYGHGEVCTAALMLGTLLSFITISGLLWLLEAHSLPLS
ncbi:AEC family transporter [Modicisalibacter tunisiensis]|uniref:AEC family transporter n=1 Tax=Modicisalibacter tunisiensis TaxID=390637 RepID=UPI001CCA7CF2|nr:AEC family transporter [Modicisalibacter tunisiensis]MBZ9540300.1 AEC family transporter [Modicisalibacter tunisiensis]